MAIGESYEEFVEKFKPKRTTDDCYTPPGVYEVIKDWAVERFGLQGKNIMRPFYPGGDFEHEKYTENDVVIDNPPFSILSEICKFYVENNVKFFMFAQAKTALGVMRGQINYIFANCSIIYENGAKVATSFVTNLGNKKIVVSGELHNRLKKEIQPPRSLPKYHYPDNVITFAKLETLANLGANVEIDAAETSFVRRLDCQKEQGKGIYGTGLLVSDSVAEQLRAEQLRAEQLRADADTTFWQLSDREKQIIDTLK